MKKILFIGMPGSGKGTQGELLEKYKIKHISTGNLTRDAWKRKDPLLLPYKESVEQGNFLPDNIIFKLIKRGTKNLTGFNGYVLDGAVRNLVQAKIAIEQNLINTVIYFTLSENEALRRLAHRMEYSEIKRTDDNSQAIKKRFEIYKKDTRPILNFLKSHVKEYYEINAARPIEKINEDVLRILKLK